MTPGEKPELLMLIGSLYSEDPEDREPSKVVALRFFEAGSDQAARVLRLARAQAKRNHPNVDQKAVHWDVYKAVAAKPGRGPHTGGYPIWLGEAVYYT